MKIQFFAKSEEVFSENLSCCEIGSALSKNFLDFNAVLFMVTHFKNYAWSKRIQKENSKVPSCHQTYRRYMSAIIFVSSCFVLGRQVFQSIGKLRETRNIKTT